MLVLVGLCPMPGSSGASRIQQDFSSCKVPYARGFKVQGLGFRVSQIARASSVSLEPEILSVQPCGTQIYLGPRSQSTAPFFWVAVSEFNDLSYPNGYIYINIYSN